VSLVSVSLPALSRVEYLHQFALAGQGYKMLSLDLLQVKPGAHVLEVGCGAGDDLVPLAERVTPGGLVVGIEPDPELLAAAQQRVAQRPSIRLYPEPLDHLRFPDGAFDRVRVDQVFQSLPAPALVLAELWRVLRPGGLLVVVEIDWGGVIVFPASPNGGDDDRTWRAVLPRLLRAWPHPLIGRQLYGLFQQHHWEHLAAQAGALVWTSWQTADSLLHLSAAALALAQEEPTRQAEVDAWLNALRAAAQHQEFLVNVPLFFACARKERYQPLAGRARSTPAGPASS
jgi:ubiquinone/menaquinone biosynthesis C-methylase UbiE